MVGAVRIHDRDALLAGILGAGLGDVDDARVEKGLLPREARVDGVGAFVRGAAPVGGVDREALPREFAPGGDVMDVAADGDAAVAARLDGAGDELRGAGVAPLAISGGLGLAEGVAGDAVGAERGEEAGRAQVGGDDFGDLAAERRGRAARDGHGGDGDGGQFLHPAADDIDLDRGGFLVLRQRGGGEERGGGEKEGKFHKIPHGRR